MAKDDQKSAIDVGAQAIYEFRAHPRRTPWDNVKLEVRNANRIRMQEVIKALSAAEYAIRPMTKRR